MSESLEQRLADALAPHIPSEWLRIDVKEGQFLLGPAVGEPLVRVALQGGEWLVTVESELAHAHFEEFEDAAGLVTGLLTGQTRCTTEYRSEILASAWFEVREGEGFRVTQQSIYLSPFDEDEWHLLPGESWRTMRRTFRLGPEGVEEQRFERLSEEPTESRPEMAGWLITALGPPVEGMRWTVAAHAQFILQAPRGWRRKVEERTEPDPHNLADFLNPAGDLLFRSRTYFRTSPSSELPVKHAKAPYSTEHTFEAASGPDSPWNKHTWTMLFRNGEEEMMSLLELIYRDGQTAQAEAIRPRIDASANASRFVPHEWDMSNQP